MNCIFGEINIPLVVLPTRTVFLNAKPMGNILDKQPFVNILSFGRCKSLAFPATAAATAAAMGTLTPMPCVPLTVAPWMNGDMTVLVQNAPALMKTSTCQCQWGGVITLKSDGQGGMGCMGVVKMPKLPVPTVPHSPRAPQKLTDLTSKPKKVSLMDSVLKKLRADFPITDPAEKAEYDRLSKIVQDRCKDLSKSELDRLNEMFDELPARLSRLEKVAIARRNLELEKAYGIRKGKPMSIADADLQKSNPFYGMDDAFGINCATCSTAYVLRTMGFDLVAKGNFPDTMLRWLSWYNSFAIWENIDGSEAKPTITYDWMKDHNLDHMTPTDYKKYLEESCKDEGIYIIGLGWKNGGGHATILQRDNGILYYVEPQVDNGMRDQYGRKSVDDLVTRLTPFPPATNYVRNDDGSIAYYDGDPVVTQYGVMRVDNKLLKTTNSGYKDLFYFNNP